MSISTLERWYASQCNGDWEYGYGVHIETLDKPGWVVQIDLHNHQEAEFIVGKGRHRSAKDDWIQYWVENQKFQIACGPMNFSEASEIFVDWFESN